VKRQDQGKQSPRALQKDEQRRFLKAVATTKSLRNRAIATVMLNCGLRLGELTQLNIADLVLTSRKHELVVRCGKGSKRRVVPLNRDAAEVLQLYVASRVSAGPEEALFVSQKRNRLSPQAVDYLIRGLGRDAGVQLSCHILRHTFVTTLIRANQDLVLVAELAGHSRLETTRRYSLPSQAVMLEAVQTLGVNYGTAAQ